MKKGLFLIVVLGILFCVSGCTWGGFKTYWADRGHDIWDVVGMRFSVGTGLMVSARATKFAQAGIGRNFEVHKYGFRGRYMGHWVEDRGEFGVGPIYAHWLKQRVISGNKFLRDKAAAEKEKVRPSDIDLYNDDRKICDAGVAVHIPCIGWGFDFEFRIFELCDFILGFTTIDMCQDDTKAWLKRYGEKKRIKEGEEFIK